MIQQNIKYIKNKVFPGYIIQEILKMKRYKHYEKIFKDYIGYNDILYSCNCNLAKDCRL